MNQKKKLKSDKNEIAEPENNEEFDDDILRMMLKRKKMKNYRNCTK